MKTDVVKSEEVVKATTKLPTEDEIIDTIIDCVFIRGIELEVYRNEFTEKRSGLITALHKLYNK